MVKKNENAPVMVVLDTSVYLAGLGSVRGGSRVILESAKTGVVEVVISALIVGEIERNLRKFSQQQRKYFLKWIGEVQPRMIKLTKGEVEKQEEKVVGKDAHVLALAKKAKAGFLVTLDKKHLLSLKREVSKLEIMNPGEFLRWLRRENG